MQWKPLIQFQRAGIPEIVAQGSVTWSHGREIIYQWGDNHSLFSRSLVKPFQIKSCIKGLHDLNDSQKAIALSSHNAEPAHILAAQSLLTKSEHALMSTPKSLPIQNFGKEKRLPKKWYHPCSGKHAAILKAAKELSWDRVGYTLPQHPFHQNYLMLMKKIFGPNWSPLATAKDGCGLATLAHPSSELAMLFASLVQEKDEDWIWSAMVNKPDLIGGFNRLDSTILKSCDGQVIAKEGADGLLGLSIKHKSYPDGLGVVLKMAHGWDSRATWYLARAILHSLGFQLRNPYKLAGQRAVVTSDILPPQLRTKWHNLEFQDSWDHDNHQWTFDFKQYSQPINDFH